MLRSEILWLKEVQQAIGTNAKIEAILCLKLFVKYSKLVRLIELNRCTHFLFQLSLLVEQRKLQNCKMLERYYLRRKQQVLRELIRQVISGRRKRAHNARANR